MNYSPTFLFSSLSFLVALNVAEVSASDLRDREHSAVVKKAEQDIIRNLADSGGGEVSSARKERAQPRQFLRKLISSFETRTEAAKIEPLPEGNEPAKAQSQARLPRIARAPKKDSPETTGAATSRKPSRLTALMSRIMVRLGLERRKEKAETEALLAGGESEQKWLNVLGNRREVRPQGAILALSEPVMEPIEQTGPDGGGGGWLGTLFRSIGSGKTDGEVVSERSRPEANGPRLLGFLRARNEMEVTRVDKMSSESFGDFDEAYASGQPEYLAVNQNRAPIHLIEPGTDLTIPLEVDGGEVGRLHAHGDEWSWVQLDSGLMGVMRNRYLREAKREEVANFLADERLSTEQHDSSMKVEVAEAGPALGGTVALTPGFGASESFPLVDDDTVGAIESRMTE